MKHQLNIEVEVIDKRAEIQAPKNLVAINVIRNEKEMTAWLAYLINEIDFKTQKILVTITDPKR